MIISADLHNHQFSSFSVKDRLINNRLQATINVCRQMLKYAVDHHEDTIIIIGDIYETKNVVEAVTNNTFHDFLMECKAAGVKVILVPGNHDIASLSHEDVTLLHPFKSHENITVAEKPMIIKKVDGFVNCAFMPFRRDIHYCRKKIAELMAKVEGESDPDDLKFLFYHGAILNAQITTREFLDANKALAVKDLHPANFDYVFLGHFHKRQKLGTNVMYVGSPLQHDMNDAGDQRGFYHFDTKHNKLIFVPTTYPTFNKITISSRDDLSKIDVLDTVNYYSITVTTPDIMEDEIKTLRRPNIKIETNIKTTSTTRMNIDIDKAEGMDIPKILKTYVIEKADKSLHDELIRMGNEYVQTV